jgi:hypothetical protein
MIQFRQKTFSEYDAMRSLYVELLKKGDKNKWKVIDKDSLIPVLRGNNVVIERFVISTSFAHRDRYRLYLKIGAKAKLPDEVRLPERVYDKRLGNATLNFNMGLFAPGTKNNNQGQQQKNMSVVFKQKEFKGGGGPPPTVSASVSPSINLTYEVKELLGDAVKYDKKERSLVLEFRSIEDAIKALNILPFGINYNIFLLV